MRLRALLVFASAAVIGAYAWYHQQSPPYPQSNFIQDLRWAPVSSVTRAAKGSDTWPITWGDDDTLYTAYADGWGFASHPDAKLSLGFARVEGGPRNFSGTNLRSSTGEQRGDGRSGKKASGMLMVDGTLFMWVRNANGAGQHCQLARSLDHAKSWVWSSWTFEEFGFCTFINFGMDYSGARDGYVYMVSHDGPNAYRPSNHFVLTRVPKSTVTARAGYEFFAGMADGGRPRWSGDISQRAPVFTSPGRALRSSISFNPGIGRYLWWQQLPDDGFDTRFRGGFGIYEAPEPWGPWRTVYFTRRWDLGPGESGHIPTKWISRDGRTIHLVFSGDDSFSVRGGTLALAEGS